MKITSNYINKSKRTEHSHFLGEFLTFSGTSKLNVMCSLQLKCEPINL